MAALEQHLYQTIVLPRKLVTGGIHHYLFCYCPLVGILYVVLRIVGLQIQRECLSNIATYGTLYPTVVCIWVIHTT